MSGDLRFGSLFSGYGGLDMGVQSVLGGSTAWHVEFDKAPSKVLAHHWPYVPNYGDITQVDWSTVEPVDVLTGGSPCQDLSHAGKRAGMTEGTRSNLWVQMRECIAALRPRLVVWENVRGALSAPADSEMEPCPGCVGGPDDGPVLRALGRVVGDLSELGYVGAWHGLRAADVGAAHGRFRVFLFAWPADADPFGGGLDGWAPEQVRRPLLRTTAAGSGEDAGLPHVPGQLTLLPTPTTRDHKGRNQRDDETCLTGALLPTPRATDGTKGGPNQRGSSGDLMLPSAVQLLPTPMVGSTSPAAHGQISGDYRARMAEALTSWGDYAPAIARWEHATGRTAPAPTEPGAKGNPRLSPAFVEWLMGLPAGHVTDTGLTRNEQLKALGNGVVPQQAAAATEWWLRQGMAKAVAS